MNTYSTKTISRALREEIDEALQSIHGYGSVEIYVQKDTVTQITVRSIKKTGTQSNGSERKSSTQAKLKKAKALIQKHKGIDK